MKTSIIVEGIDGVGKSTLAANLAQHFNMTLNIIGGPPKTDAIAYAMSCDQLDRAMNERMVFDRITSMSRLCYENDLCPSHGVIMRRQMNLITNNCHVIWCTNDAPSPVRKAYKHPEHMDRIIRERDEILARYIHFMSKLVTPLIRYDWTKMTFRGLVDLLEEAEEAKHSG